MFHSNVQLYNDKLRAEIDKIKLGWMESCVERVIPTNIDGQENTYICKTCVKHLKKKKLPPMSAMNGMQLKETDKQIDDQNLKLSELDSQEHHIPKNISAAKIKMDCPKRYVDKCPNQ